MLLSKINLWLCWLWGNLKALCGAVILVLGMLLLLLSVTSSLGKYLLELLQSSELQVSHCRGLFLGARNNQPPKRRINKG